MNLLPDLHSIPVLKSAVPVGNQGSVLESRFLQLIDGRKTISQLGVACGVEADLAQRIVAKWIQTGHLGVQALPNQSAVAAASSSQAVSNNRSDSTSSVAEIVDLDKLTPQNIEKLCAQIEKSNYYEVLGVSPVAERTEIRSAYFALSKKYHPDTVFRDADAQLKQMLGRIFDRITIAYDTLSGKSKRIAYDETIADQIEMLKMEHSLRRAVDSQSGVRAEHTSGGEEQAAASARPKIRVARTSLSPEARSNGETGPGPSSGAPDPTSRTSYRRIPVQDQVAVSAARISRIPAIRSSFTAEMPSQPPRTESASPSRQPSTPTPSTSATNSTTLSAEERELRRQKWKRDRLKKAFDNTSTISTGARRPSSPTTSVSESNLLQHAQIAIEHQEYDHAVQYLEEILRRDGENSAASMLLHRAQSGKVKANLNALIRQGRFEQSRGNVREALEFYESALKLDGRDIDAKHHIAAALLETKKDLRRAVHLMREVVAQGRGKAQYYATLAELLELTGENKKATDAMEKALGLAPDNENYRKRLKMMRK